MKTREEILQIRVDTGYAEINWNTVKGKNYITHQDVTFFIFSDSYKRSANDILFWDSNFWEIMYDEDYFIDYLPAVQICNEINIYAPLWYQACCAVENDRLKFINTILK